MSPLVSHAKAFTAETSQPGNLWRMNARHLIIELTQEVERLEAVIMDGAVAAHLKEHPTRKGDGPW